MVMPEGKRKESGMGMTAKQIDRALRRIDRVWEETPVSDPSAFGTCQSVMRHRFQSVMKLWHPVRDQP